MLSHHCDVVAAENPGPYSSPGVTLMVVLTRAVTQLFLSNYNYFFNLPTKEVSVSLQALRDVRFESKFKVAVVLAALGWKGWPGLKGTAELCCRGAGDG